MAYNIYSGKGILIGIASKIEFTPDKVPVSVPISKGFTQSMSFTMQIDDAIRRLLNHIFWPLKPRPKTKKALMKRRIMRVIKR